MAETDGESVTVLALALADSAGDNEDLLARLVASEQARLVYRELLQEALALWHEDLEKLNRAQARLAEFMGWSVNAEI